MTPFKILFFGDVVGAIGRAGLVQALPELRAEHAPDFVIANVENLSHGRGITAKTLLELDAIGIDAYTSGNHVWENPTGLTCFDDARWKDRLIRPANVVEARAGRGSVVIKKNGKKLLLLNLMGSILMKDEVSNPFKTFDDLVKAYGKVDLTFVDFHAEATSEKEALGHYTDGRATAVFGSHTHVPTADQKILSQGTAYVTDVGRNGAYDSIVGFEKISAMKRYLGPEKGVYEIPKSGKVEINCMLLEADLDTGKALRLDRIRKIIDI